MFRSAHVAIMAPTDTARCHLGGGASAIPTISFGPSGEDFQITLNPRVLTAAERAAWLRSLAVQLEELAEQVEQRHGEALAEQHIAEAKAQAGIGGAR